MNVTNLTCKACGGPISVPPDLESFNCAYCGAALVVQRGEGYVALKLADQVAKVIQDVGKEMHTVIREEAQETQDELKKIQVTQEIGTLQLQLTSVQAEIRALERGQQNGRIRSQINDLRRQEAAMRQRLAVLRPLLAGPDAPKVSALPPAPPKGLGKTPFFQSLLGKSCLNGCAVYLILGMALVAIASPLDEFVFHTTSADKLGPFSQLIAWVVFIAASVAFFFYLMKGESIFTFLLRLLKNWMKK